MSAPATANSACGGWIRTDIEESGRVEVTTQLHGSLEKRRYS
jgi:hypothetical protein